MAVFKPMTTACLLCLALQAPAPAHAQSSMNPGAAVAQPEDKLNDAIANWVKTHPEEIRRAVAGPITDIEQPFDGVLGGPKWDTVLVAFIDRAAQADKGLLEELASIAANDGAIRVLVKELPLESNLSTQSARLAIAARKTGDSAWLTFETAIAAHADALTEKTITDAAASAGLSPKAIADAMSDPFVDAYLAQTRQIATALGIKGTPAFLLREKAFLGAKDVRTLMAAITESRRK